jgi:7-cyano-7-deazaguanine synthase
MPRELEPGCGDCEMTEREKVLLIYSGGADSTTLLYHLLDCGWDVETVSFDYGQRHRKEIECARAIAQLMEVQWDCVVMPDFGNLCTSSLLGDSDIPDGHYESENMKQTVVPNRNMMMLSVAAGIAISRSYDSIAFAAHAGDHAIYPDCRHSFVTSMMSTINEGNWLDYPFTILSPFLKMSKTDIFELGRSLGVPYDQTWTCYKGLDKPCGVCGSCVERREAEMAVGL